MFYTKDVEVWKKGAPRVVNGVNLGYLPAQLAYADLVDIQPYSSAQAKRDYGLDIDTTNTMFSEVREVDIGGHFVRYNNNDYEIREKIVWDDYMQLLLERLR